jgi:hypothetical protein
MTARVQLIPFKELKSHKSRQIERVLLFEEKLIVHCVDYSCTCFTAFSYDFCISSGQQHTTKQRFPLKRLVVCHWCFQFIRQTLWKYLLVVRWLMQLTINLLY